MDTSTNFPPQKTRRKKGTKILSKILIVFLVLLAGFIFWKYFFTYSEGERFGLLQKFSRKGNVFKTYEGELILSSVRGNANVAIASEKFYFSVGAKDIADQLMRLQGHSVTVHYKQKNGTLPWRGESEYIVDSVRVEP
jgi:hypothetical protein